ncbi:MAG: hypothetical protein HQL54_09325 [Magnetococcales bacterium]|nr:hypothetical protein [Magnetococcales bacterium]
MSQKKATATNAQRELIVSGRNLGHAKNILRVLELRYEAFSNYKIRSVFGFVQKFTPFYGGRGYNKPNALSFEQLDILRQNNISLDLVLSNHFFSQEAYKKTWPLLEQLALPGNGVICLNDDLTRMIKRDFPGYTRRLSAIREVDTLEGIESALELYDFVTLHIDQNDRIEFLQSIPWKEKVIVFGNGRCGYPCRNRSCYLGISEVMFGKQETSKCSKGGQSKKKSPMEEDPYYAFDLEDPRFDGFSTFKLIGDIPPPL